MISLVWLIPVLPFVGFLINGLLGKSLSKTLVGIIGSLVLVGAFCLSLGIFNELSHSDIKSVTFNLFDWIQVGSLTIPFEFLIDPLTCIMLLVITGVGSLIHIYSAGYMYDDEGFAKFFAYLNLFVFFMLLLVLGANYVIMFIGWEGVGLCSYLLIGFWFKNHDYNDAAKKAFVMNRVGDLGFLLGMFLIFENFGSLSYTDVFANAGNLAVGAPVLTTITLLLFVGATGKSAQLPLYTWLPDAMAGPTPVSALIHAATMVTAGIYMIARSNILFVMAPITMDVIAVVGLVTALLAATIAITQTDIKKVLAYSTVSQLGYMFLGLGVGAFTGSVFHLMTHAFFKALLFLGAGSVIHAMSGEQDIRNMGGLKKSLPVTFITMLLATIAIAGIPPFSGFFSKDEILAHVFEHNPILWVLGVLGALMTAYYMFRMLFVTFYGSFRGTADQKHHLHESPLSMTIPLMVLAVLSVIGGWIGVPEVLGGEHHLETFLAPVFERSKSIVESHAALNHETEYLLMGISVVGVLLAIFMAWLRFVRNAMVPVADTVELSFMHRLSLNKYYVDEFYTAVITKPLDKLSDVFYRIVDVKGIDALVNGTARSMMTGSKNLRLLQSGTIGFYIFAMVIGIIGILVWGFWMM